MVQRNPSRLDASERLKKQLMKRSQGGRGEGWRTQQEAGSGMVGMRILEISNHRISGLGQSGGGGSETS